MRYIIDPGELLTIGAHVLRMRDIVNWIVDRAALFNNTGPGIRLGMRLQAAFATTAAIYSLSDEDWAAARASFDAPDCGYFAQLIEQSPAGERVARPFPGRVALRVADAFAAATTEEPNNG